jgi:hypothetical protein
MLLEWVSADLLRPTDDGFALHVSAVSTSDGDRNKSTEPVTERWQWIAAEDDASTADTTKLIRLPRASGRAPNTPERAKTALHKKPTAPATILFAGVRKIAAR